ncbi:transporter substrate-binding domain-containing protein [Vibrio sp. ZSDZ34]|uniref:Transporter substrate-binding domain-containing protein n=1 Tax=Vibrio gelatinilyticus TaxID=2893468 RepID=A0A9X1WA16_9VIBR|nr:transporter substrate-binding domain-containing protein [Vibrio gelatinilyticus]MCJ2377077.1 transporter substrate-binding domain-containing protein [Vibrio gelatinilyticus]
MIARKTRRHIFSSIASLLLCIASFSSFSMDLEEVKKRGVLRHLGVSYANFVSYIGQNDFQYLSGLDVELMQGFAKSLGVEYQYVPAEWTNVFGKLTGQNTQFTNNQLVFGESMPIEGDIIANGVTILEWRAQVADFSDDYFPSGVWLIAKSNSSMRPIRPSGELQQDIAQVKTLMRGKDVLAMEQSCLDPNLYNLYETGANIILPVKQRKLNEMVPAVLNSDAESTLLDVPDTLIALEKWPGEIKVIGPVSEDQRMAAVFRKESPKLRHAFNQYLSKIRSDGTYEQLVEKYYPSVFYFYGDYFKGNSQSQL